MGTAGSIRSESVLYRFGPYEVDTAKNELRKFGQRIRMERKPLQVLLALLERSGEVLTRSHLQRSVWGEEVFVDFEKGLTVAMAKVRAVINDSAETPKYIETVAGEGYRFIAKVERVTAAEASCSHPAEGSGTAPTLPAPNAEGGEVPSRSTEAWQLRVWKSKAVIATAVTACLFMLVVAAMILPQRRPSQPEALHNAKIMLVVLPFENLSGDIAQEYLGDGMTEELSERLGNLSPERLGVIGRTSAMTYKHSSRTISQIGKDLSVGYVLEGSVRRQGNKLRVTAQLVEVSDQAHVWAQDYDQDARDLLQVEDSIAFDIARQVGVQIALDKNAKPASAHVPSPEAHEAYLLARYYWNRRGPAGWQMAEKYFRSAIEKDPLYASAYAGLAECRIPLAEAKASALKAVELDPTSGETHTALGRVQLFRELDVVAAETSFKRAIQLDPNYAITHHSYGELLVATGRLQEAITEKRKAEVLDPLSSVIKGSLADALSLAGRQEEAEQELKMLSEMDPHLPGPGLFATIYLRKGRYKEAIREYEASEPNGGDPPLGFLGYAFARSGNEDAALKMSARLQALDMQSGSAALDLAIVQIGLGNNNEALACLEKAYQEHNDDGLLMLSLDPIFDPLRSEPRFQEILRRLKLTK